MRFVHWKFSLACCLVVLGAAGCLSPYGYGPGAYPGTYAPVPPGGTYTTPSAAPQLGVPQTYSPGTTHSPSNNAPAWRGSEDAGGTQNAPKFDSGTNDFSTPSTEKLVPKYGDPNELEVPPSGGNSNFDNNFDSSDRSGVEFDGIEGSASANPTADETEDVFEAPISVTPTAMRRTLSDNKSPNPYDHDPKNYAWLRGKVDFDQQDNTWQIIYNLTPEPSDRFGGAFTLDGNAGLNALKDGDVVFVEGRVDYDKRDSFGKPHYQIDHLARLKPKQ